MTADDCGDEGRTKGAKSLLAAVRDRLAALRLRYRRFRVERAYAKLVRHRDGLGPGLSPIFREWELMSRDGVKSLVVRAPEGVDSEAADPEALDYEFVWHWPDDWELGDVAGGPPTVHADPDGDRLVVGGRSLVVRDEAGDRLVVDEVDADNGSVIFAEPGPDGGVRGGGRRVVIEVAAAPSGTLGDGSEVTVDA